MNINWESGIMKLGIIPVVPLLPTKHGIRSFSFLLCGRSLEKQNTARDGFQMKG